MKRELDTWCMFIPDANSCNSSYVPYAFHDRADENRKTLLIPCEWDGRVKVVWLRKT